MDIRKKIYEVVDVSSGVCVGVFDDWLSADRMVERLGVEFQRRYGCVANGRYRIVEL